MRRLAIVVILSLVATHACTCTDDTSGLGGDDAAAPRDALPDATLMDPPDTGMGVCVRAEDCPSSEQPCPTLFGCGCGSFKTCNAGQCVRYANDCFDGGVPAPDAEAPDTGTSTVTVECTSKAQCNSGNRPAPPPPQLCMNTEKSCIENECVLECTTARDSCVWDRAVYCLTCDVPPDPSTTACIAAQPCIPAVTGSAFVESTTCGNFPGTAIPFAGATVTLTRSIDDCMFEVMMSAGAAPLGTFWALSDGKYYGEIPGFGGGCVGEILPTGLYRVAWGCPDCEFILAYQ